MATSTCLVDTNIDSLTWNSGDTLVINNGAVVTCNSTQNKFWGPITLTNGTLNIVNPSTTSGVVFALGRSAYAIGVQPGVTTGGGEAIFNISGNWINIGTGNGSANQTFTSPFNQGYAIAAVWVETASGTANYVPWLNVGNHCGQQNVTWRDQWDEVTNGERGNFFRQEVNNASGIVDQALFLTGGITASGSKSVICTSTTNLYPGASVSGVGLAYNTVAETITSASGFTVNINASGTSSGNIYTCYNPTYAQTTTTLTFGDGTRGNVVPSGCIVRVPNIMLTDFTPVNILGLSASYLYMGGCVAYTNTGKFLAQNCLFDDWYMSVAQASKVSLSNVGLFTLPYIQEVYDLDMNNFALGIPIDRKVYGAITGPNGSTQASWSTYFNWPMWYPRDQRCGNTRQMIYSYISNANLTNLYLAGCLSGSHLYNTGAAYAYSPYKMIEISYSKNITVSNVKAWLIYGIAGARAAIGSAGYNDNCAFSNFTLYGFSPPVFQAQDNDCTLSNVYVQGDYRDYAINYTASVANRIPYDIATKQKLVAGTKYYFKPRSYRGAFDQTSYFDGNEVCIIPYKSNRKSASPAYSFCLTASGTVTATLLGKYPQGSLPSWEWYRGTTPGFTARDSSTRMGFIGSFATTLTMTDGPVSQVVATTSGTLTFAVGKTITRGGTVPGSWITDGYQIGKTIVVTGTTANNGIYTISVAPTATVLTVREPMVTEAAYSGVATVNGRAPTLGSTYYYVLRKYDNTPTALTNCVMASGSSTMTTTSDFYNLTSVTPLYGTSGETTLYNKGIGIALSDLTVGQPVSGTGFASGTVITSVNDYSYITLSKPLTSNIDAGTAYFGICSGLYIYYSTTFRGDGLTVKSVESSTSLTTDRPSPTLLSGSYYFMGGEEFQEQEVTIRDVATCSNIILRNQDFTNAQWTKSNMLASGAIGVASTYPFTPWQGPFDRTFITYTLAEDTACKLIATSANGTVTNAVTTVSGTAYNASVWIQRDLTTNTIPVSGWMSFGTASGTFVASGMWQQINVNYTAISTTTNFVVGLYTSAHYVYAASTMVTPGSTPKPAVTTTTAAVTLNPCAQEITTARVWCDSDDADHGSVSAVLTTAPAGTKWTDIHMSTASGFTPTVANKVATTKANFCSATALNFANNCLIQNVSGVNYQYYNYISTTKNSTIKNCYLDHMYNGIYSPFYNTTNSNDNLISNVYIDHAARFVSAMEPIIDVNNCDGLTVQNLRADSYNVPGFGLSLNRIDKGVYGCRGSNCNATSTWVFGLLYNMPAVSYPAVYGTIFHEYYSSPTEGSLFISFTESQEPNPPYVLTGSGLFNNTGKLFFRAPGDSIEYTWPHRILGVSGFANIPPKWNGLDLGSEVTTNFAIYSEYCIDTSAYGTGYGSWKQLTRTNLKNEVVSPTTGFLFKLRFTCRQGMKFGTKASNFVIGEVIKGATSSATAFVQDVEYLTSLLGNVNLTGISGTFTPTELIKTSDLTTTRATNVATNSLALYPQITSYVDGLQIYTLVDQTVMYPLTDYTLTVSNLMSGTIVGFVEHGTENLITAHASWSDTNGEVTYTYPDTHAGTEIDIKLLCSGCMIQKIEYVLTAENAILPVTQVTDYAFNPSGTVNVTFDAANHIVVCNAGLTSFNVIDLYSFWKIWAMTDDNIRYNRVFNEIGGNDIDTLAGTSIPIYAYLYGTWRIRSQEANHTLNVTGGILLVEGGGDPFLDTLGAYRVRINYQQPVQAITVSTGGGGGSTPTDIAAAVWNETLSSHTAADTTGKKLSDIYTYTGSPSGSAASGTVVGMIMANNSLLVAMSGNMAQQSTLLYVSGNLAPSYNASGILTAMSGTMAQQSTLTSVSGIVTTNQNTIITVSGDVNTLRNNVATVSGNLNTTNNTIITVSGDVNTLRTNFGTTSGDVTTIKNNLVTVSGNLYTLSNNVDTISGVVRINQNTLITVSGNILTLSNNLYTVSGVIVSISGSMAQQSTSLYISGNMGTSTYNPSGILVAISGSMAQQTTLLYVSGNMGSSIVTVSGLTPSALSQIVASGNAANWNATTAVTTVTVSGLTPYALSQIVASGDAAGWNIAGSGGSGGGLDSWASGILITISGDISNLGTAEIDPTVLTDITEQIAGVSKEVKIVKAKIPENLVTKSDLSYTTKQLQANILGVQSEVNKLRR